MSRLNKICDYAQIFWLLMISLGSIMNNQCIRQLDTILIYLVCIELTNICGQRESISLQKMLSKEVGSD